jgi:hypothetical protein
VALEWLSHGREYEKSQRTLRTFRKREEKDELRRERGASGVECIFFLAEAASLHCAVVGPRPYLTILQAIIHTVQRSLG